MKTISEVEESLERSLSVSWDRISSRPIPQGYRLRVQLQDTKHRKKRSTASADHWSPESGEILVWFEPAEDDQFPIGVPGTSAGTVLDSQPRPARVGPPQNPMSDLIKALDRAERRPGLDFIALTWFRDAALSAESFEWTKSESTKREIISEAIHKRIILTSKVPNPKIPERPVTAIRLNRLLPEVKQTLGYIEELDSDFHPVEIRGEPLSATIMRERHR